MKLMNELSQFQISIIIVVFIAFIGIFVVTVIVIVVSTICTITCRPLHIATAPFLRILFQLRSSWLIPLFLAAAHTHEYTCEYTQEHTQTHTQTTGIEKLDSSAKQIDWIAKFSM